MLRVAQVAPRNCLRSSCSTAASFVGRAAGSPAASQHDTLEYAAEQSTPARELSRQVAALTQLDVDHRYGDKRNSGNGNVGYEPISIKSAPTLRTSKGENLAEQRKLKLQALTVGDFLHALPR
jgi:hypothetical protein